MHSNLTSLCFRTDKKNKPDFLGQQLNKKYLLKPFKINFATHGKLHHCFQKLLHGILTLS